MELTTNNTVTLNSDGYVEVKVKGEQSYLSFDLIRNRVKDLVHKLELHGTKVLGLVDLTEMTTFNTGSNKAALEILESISYQKVALFGGDTPITTVTKLVIAAIGKSENTRVFKDRAEALKWLLAENSSAETT